MTSTTMIVNEFIGRTIRLPRPRADDERKYLDPADLAAHQRRWDSAESQRVENVKAQDSRSASVEATRLAEIEARQVAARADLERELERRFMTQPAATAADWAACRDILVREALLAAPDPIAEQRAELLRTGAFPSI